MRRCRELEGAEHTGDLVPPADGQRCASNAAAEFA
jgi:hypothetical protein